MQTQTWKDNLALVQTAFSLARDLLLIFGFAALLVFHSKVNSLLTKSGVTEVDLGFAKWQRQQVADANAQGKAAAQSLDATVQSIQDTQGAANALKLASKRSADPAVKKLVDNLLASLNGTLSTASAANQSLQQTIVTQQSILQTTGGPSTSAAATGWIYVGAVEQDNRNAWMPGSPKTLAPSVPVPQPGQTVTLTDDAYLRADPNGDRYNAAPIQQVVRAGTAIKVSGIGYSHALAGGWFLWLKATTQ